MCCKLGHHTYRNVTVTTKSKNYIFIMHSTGMENIKLAEVPPDIRTKLGYSAVLEAEPGKRVRAHFRPGRRTPSGKCTCRR